jgi:hypothetical protein
LREFFEQEVFWEYRWLLSLVAINLGIRIARETIIPALPV